MRNLPVKVTRAILAGCMTTLALMSASWLWVASQDTVTLAPALLLMTSMLLALPLTLFSGIILIQRLANRQPKADNFERGPVARTLALLAVVGLIASSILIDTSLWTSPMDGRAVYENIAKVLSAAVLFFVLILNAVQTDIYWISTKATKLLDERQQTVRRQVFETSYKLLAILLAFSAFSLVNYANNSARLTEINFAHFPGSLGWLAFNLVVAAIATPLVVAALRRK